MSEIKDSGNRIEFATGAVRDIQDDKGRCDLLPLDTIAYLVDDSCGHKYNVMNHINNFLMSGDIKHLYAAITTFCEFRGWSITECLLEVSIHYRDGAIKYQPYNWMRGIPVSSYVSSGVRHALNHFDSRMDERHDRAFVWNMLGAIWTMEHKTGTELIDIPFELLSGCVTSDDSLKSFTSALSKVAKAANDITGGLKL